MPSDQAAPPPARSGLGAVYSSFLDPSSIDDSTTATTTSISRAPVVFHAEQAQEDSAKKPLVNSAALRFQPTKRPQVTTQKPRPKQSLPRAPLASVPVSGSNQSPAELESSAVPSQVKGSSSTLADWTAAANDDVNGFYGGAGGAGEKRQRGGRKRRKKNHREGEEAHRRQDWDDIYDPSRPNSYEEYKHSDEMIREIREWKDRLYAHRMRRRSSTTSDGDSEDENRQTTNHRFGPPSAYSFAPPPMEDLKKDAISIPPPSTDMVDDPISEDAYQRIRMGQQSLNASSVPLTSNPPPGSTNPTGTISRAPVRYNLPTAPSDMPLTEAELEEGNDDDNNEDDPQHVRSLRPGQKGFAQRFMSKYGWTKGMGLGATGSGIVNPLRVQVDKGSKNKKKKGDVDDASKMIIPGGGGRGKIIGGTKNVHVDEEEGMFGKMSQVVVLAGMINLSDLDADGDDMLRGPGEVEAELMQEIGEECNEKYGRVERVLIHRGDHGTDDTTTSTPMTPRVFVKFTSQLSGLRAVNALQGRMFNGNIITAKFFDLDRFEEGSLV